MKSLHLPVLREEILETLKVSSGKIYLDLTEDGSGHTIAMLKKSNPDGVVIGFDMDKKMLLKAKERLESYKERVHLVHTNFANLSEALDTLGITQVDGILADLGLSSNQLDIGDRGFSFMHNGPIDMRMDTTAEQTAADLIDELDLAKLANIIAKYGEQPCAMRIARAIKDDRQKGRLNTTHQLADTVANAIPRKKHPKRIHPATKTFQALRIATNKELESIEQMLPQALQALKVGGRLAVISYHSLEDRIIRHTFKDWERSCICPPRLPVCACDEHQEVKILTKKPILPSEKELEENLRSRSAKLRVVERI